MTSSKLAHKRAWADHIVAQMAGFAPVVAKPMFGGFGIYCQGLMFALLFEERLYFKVDAINVGDFTERGLRPFTYESKGKTGTLKYHEAPAEVFDDLAEMALWARNAHACAVRAASAKAPKPAKGPRQRGSLIGAGEAASVAAPVDQGLPSDGACAEELSALLNLGPASVAMLNQAGILDLVTLRGLGAVRAYARVKLTSPKASLNLLWALEGALSGRPWQEVADADRASLLMALDDALAAQGPLSAQPRSRRGTKV